MKIPQYGDVIVLDLDPTKGHEQGGYRPCVVVSNSKYNEVTKMGTVMPITTKVKGYPFEVTIPKDVKTKGVILSDSIKTIDFTARNVRVVGRLPKDTLEKCLNNLDKLLGE